MAISGRVAGRFIIENLRLANTVVARQPGAGEKTPQALRMNPIEIGVAVIRKILILKHTHKGLWRVVVRQLYWTGGDYWFGRKCTGRLFCRHRLPALARVIRALPSLDKLNRSGDRYARGRGDAYQRKQCTKGACANPARQQ